MAKNIFRIPLYLKSPTMDGLVKLMLKNNVSQDKEFEYFSIQKQDGNWIAWYYTTVRDQNGNGTRTTNQADQ